MVYDVTRGLSAAAALYVRIHVVPFLGLEWCPTMVAIVCTQYFPQKQPGIFASKLINIIFASFVDIVCHSFGMAKGIAQKIVDNNFP